MDLAAIRTECQARGFDFDSSTRWGYWINLAYTKVCEREAWPFLEATTTGTSPLTISDLRAVISVADTTNPAVLEFEDYRTLRESDPALSATGTPYCWYQSASTEITAYPTASDSLSVRYLKVPTALSADSDTPILPSPWHYLLVDGAVTEAYVDSDNAEMAETVGNRFEAGILAMSDSLLAINYDSPRTMVAYGSTDW